MGPEVYETIGSALRQIMADAEKLPDGGNAFKRDLVEELIEIDASFEQLATDAPHGRCLNFQKTYLFHDDIQMMKGIVLSNMSAKDS